MEYPAGLLATFKNHEQYTVIGRPSVVVFRPMVYPCDRALCLYSFHRVVPGTLLVLLIRGGANLKASLPFGLGQILLRVKKLAGKLHNDELGKQGRERVCLVEKRVKQKPAIVEFWVLGFLGEVLRTKGVCGSRSKGPCKEFSIRWPSVLVEVAPRKIRDGVAKVTFLFAKVLRSCILRISTM